MADPARTGGGAAAAAVAAAALVGALGAEGCGPASGDGDAGRPDAARATAGDTVSGRSVFEVQEAHADEWEALDGVVGTGVGRCEGEPCIKVFVAERTPAVSGEIPTEVEGYPVRVEVTGRFRPRGDTSGPG